MPVSALPSIAGRAPVNFDADKLTTALSVTLFTATLEAMTPAPNDPDWIAAAATLPAAPMVKVSLTSLSAQGTAVLSQSEVIVLTPLMVWAVPVVT